MEKAIKLLQLVDKSNFINVYFVTKKKGNDYTIESIAFLTREEAEQQKEYKNRKDNAKYVVFHTCAHI